MSGPSKEKPHPPHETRIAVIGAGTLGCALMPRLARLRIAAITIIDGDRVEEGDLERQPLYALADVGHPKATTARGWLQLIGPGIEVIAVDRSLDADNARVLLEGHHIVADCADDLRTKQLIDRTCAELAIPLVSGALHRRQGQVILLQAPGTGSMLDRGDLFSRRAGVDQEGCDMRHVPEGSIEAVGMRMMSTLRSVLTGQPVVNGAIALYDHDPGSWTTFDPPART